MRVVSFKLDLTTLELLDKYAIEHGMERSEAIRRAIVLMLSEEGLLSDRVQV